MSSKIVKRHIKCPLCGSSDALSLYDNGLGTCFACNKTKRWEAFGHQYTEYGESQEEKINYFNEKKHLTGTPDFEYNSTIRSSSTSSSSYPKVERPSIVNSSFISSSSFPSTTNSSTTNRREEKEIEMITEKINTTIRGLTPKTMDFFGVTLQVSKDLSFLVFPFGERALKLRAKEDKNKQYVKGEFNEAPLFGQDKFNASSSKAITITEGELDAMSVFQMLGSEYPSVSVKSGAAGAKRDCQKQRDYINSFDKIYLCFDNDDPGKKAEQEVASLFNPNKVFIVDLTKFKDANDYLTNGQEKEFVRTWWNAKRHRPKNIVSTYSEIESILSQPQGSVIATFPFPRLNELLCGIQFGQVFLITAQEKVGKTEFIRAIEYHLLKTTDYNIGVIHLEEKERRAIQGLIGYEMNRHVHRPDSGVSLEDQIKAYKSLTGKEDRIQFYQHFGSEDPNVILDIIRHMVVVDNCKFIFLDHITMLVTGFEGDDERKKLDFLSTRLAELTRELDFTLFLVSHVNDEGKTRGSRNISKVASAIIHIDRNIEAPDEDMRNTISVLVKGNRDGSDTGPSNPLKFDRETFTITEISMPRYDEEIKPETMVEAPVLE